MKKTILIGIPFVVVILTLGLFLFSNKNEAPNNEEKDYDYKIIATSYSEERTEIIAYYDNLVVEVQEYSINGVERYTKLNDEYIYSETDSKIIDVSNNHSYDISWGPVDMLEDNNGNNVIIHKNSIFGFFVKRYDEEFNITYSSDNIPGIAEQAIFFENEIYVLSVVYDSSNNRHVTMYIVNPDTFDVEEEILIPDLTMGFYFEVNQEELTIYGHQNENSDYLGISVYDLETKQITTTEITEDVMWISNIYHTDDSIFITNQYSVIKLNQNNEVVATYESDSVIKDFAYISENEIHILQAKYSSHLYEMIKVDSDLNIIETTVLDLDGLRPTKILID